MVCIHPRVYRRAVDSPKQWQHSPRPRNAKSTCNPAAAFHIRKFAGTSNFEKILYNRRRFALFQEQTVQEWRNPIALLQGCPTLRQYRGRSPKSHSGSPILFSETEGADNHVPSYESNMWPIGTF